ncbi:MAG: CYTH domain-containing protein [Schwartzia sp.]|nr:CYTH domain-containing protein [Schwartzia sp. (in: firmicutes)]
MEIERQFLVAALPGLPEAQETIRQGYVAFLPEIRIRDIDGSHFWLTIKRGAGLAREEWETEISRQEFDSLAARLYPETRMVEKRRCRIPLPEGLVAEFHVHEGHLAGFNYVEVEFPTTDAANAFQPPAWFGREVTEDPRFAYTELARVGAASRLAAFLRR